MTTDIHKSENKNILTGINANAQHLQELVSVCDKILNSNEGIKRSIEDVRSVQDEHTNLLNIILNSQQMIVGIMSGEIQKAIQDIQKKLDINPRLDIRKAQGRVQKAIKATPVSY